MKTLVAALALALLGLAGWLVYEMGHRSARPPQARGAVLPPARPEAPQAVADVRAQIKKTVATEVAPIQTMRELDPYLTELEARARRNGRVSALEVEPGMEAIQKVAGPERAQERIVEFTQKMAQLSAQLDGRDRAPAPPDFDGLARRIERSSGSERDDLFRKYHAAIDSLPLAEQAPEVERLNRLADQAR